MQKRLLISLLMVCASIAAFGQAAWGPMSGRVFEESTDPLRSRPQGLVGAVVSVEGKADTLHTTTDYDGNFYFKRVPSGVVKVHGEQIARIYVNDKLIFGDDPAAALNTLLASDVVKLEVFDEDTDEDRRQNRRFAQQQKVMNIRTRKDFSSMWGGVSIR